MNCWLIAQVSGRVVMKELSIMFHNSLSFWRFCCNTEKSAALASPTVNDPNSVNISGSCTPSRSQMILIWAMISSAMYS